MALSEKLISETIIRPIEEKIGAVEERLREEWEKDREERDTHVMEKHSNELKALRDELKSEIEKLKARYSLPGSEPTGDEKKDFSLAKSVLAIRSGNWYGAELELEVFKEMRKKAGEDAFVPWDGQKTMSAGVDTSGGFLVPNENVRPVIELLRSRMVTIKLGAREMDVVGSPVMIPKQTGSTTAHWVGEGVSIPPSDLAIGQVTGRPHTIAALTKLSNLLMELSQPGADQLIREDFAAQLARGLDYAALAGVGANAQPLGIIDTPDVKTTAVSGTPTYDELIAFPHKLRQGDAFRGQMGYVMHPDSYHAIETIKDPTDGSQPLMRRLVGAFAGGFLGGAGGLTNGAANVPAVVTMLGGYPVETSTQLSDTVGGAGSIIFGNFEDLMFLNWGGMQLAASSEAGNSFETDQTYVRALMRRDVIIRHPQSFCIAT